MTVVIVSAALFSIGLYAVMIRRDLIGVLAGIEVMIAGALLLLVVLAASLNPGGPQGASFVQAFGLLVLVVAAAEAAVGFALLVVLARTRGTTQVDELTEVRG